MLTKKGILTNLIELVPARFPIVVSMISGTVFYLPTFLKAYKHAESKTAASITVALLYTICAGSFFVFLFNGFLLGWLVCLSKILSKQQYAIQPIKKLIYMIALSQPFLFVSLLFAYNNIRNDTWFYYVMLLLISLVIVIRLLVTLVWMRTRMAIKNLGVVVSLVPFVDCWGVLYILILG